MKLTKVQLELSTDIHVLLMVESRIRREIFYLVLRGVKANNKRKNIIQTKNRI